MGSNGTRVTEPNPLSEPWNAAPAKAKPLTLTVACAGGDDCNVVICETSHPLVSKRPTRLDVCENTGCQTKLITARCRMSSADVPFSER